MATELKTVKEVFPDEKFNELILNSKIKSANIYKKTNDLALTLISENKVDLKSIYEFERFLKNKFRVKEARIIIEANIDFNIDREWEGITRYLGAKHPMTRPILINSKPIIKDKSLQVKLAIKGRDFLSGGGFEN